MDWLHHPTLENIRQQLVEHPLYKLLDSPEAIRTFMEHHVWCVWDFQSLLKSMQRHFTCITIPWQPTPAPLFRRLINEIVLAEESDEDGQGGYLSHFELYLRAMKEAHANTTPMESFLKLLQQGKSVPEALQEVAPPPAVIPFVLQTLHWAQFEPIHKVASAFTLGREDLLPDLFQQILNRVADRENISFEILEYYLHRHIELDENTHGPQALAMLDHVCENDPVKMEEAMQAASESLSGRLDLWNKIVSQLA